MHEEAMVKSKKLTTVAATLGTLLEWAEYTFFAYMAEQLSQIFFSTNDPTLARLKTYGIFATSYFMRPLGAILFGTMGDKYGRKPALLASMTLMGCATVGIGCLPTYAEIGSYAAILLMLMRMLQGLAVSGEFHGAITFLHEQEKSKPFWRGSLAPFAAASGMSVGALAAYLTCLPGVPAWSWRIPFLMSGILCALALYLRKNALESPQFILAKKQQLLSHNPVLTAFKHQKIGIWLSASLSLFIAVYVYLGSVFFKRMAMEEGLVSSVLVSQIITFGQASAALCILFFGKVADQVSGRRLCLFGLACASIACPFIVYCAQSGQITLLIFGQLLFAIINGMVSAPMMTLIMQHFPTASRFSGSALGWSLSAALFGGTALMVAETMIQVLHWRQGPGLYMSLAAFVAFCVLKSIEHPRNQNEYINVTITPSG